MPKSFPPIDSTLPRSHELEVSIFGPGVGECIVVHLGDGQWMIVDSCLDPSSKQSVSIQYLEDLGVDIATAVKVVLVTHWHDDHIRGLSKVVEKCKSARVCYSAALLKQEFLSLVSTYSGRLSLVDRHTAGTKEISCVIKVLESRVHDSATYCTDSMVPVVADKVLFETNAGACSCTVRSLSPSDKAFEKALISFSQMIPDENDERVTLTSQNIQNHNAIALWIQFNDQKVLLGSDLEETGNPQMGWSAVVDSVVCPNGKAGIFKIPHHGSPNGHHDKVWAEMVESDNPVSVVTSYSKGSTPRPQHSDIDRIKNYTSNLFYTSKEELRLPKRESAVERTLRGMVTDRKVLGAKAGHIQIRAYKNDQLTINLQSPAKKL